MARRLAPSAVLLTAIPLAALSLGAPAARADYASGQSIQEQQILDYGPNSKPRGLLDAANPIDLMNRLRRGTALDNATNPGDAVDQALRDLELKSAPAGGPAGSASPGSGPMKAP
jgi:hypothetical protein